MNREESFDGPQVSIGLPVYNGENFLEQAIQSFVDQTFSDFELIISDNASTDRTPDICRAWAKRDSRIRYSRMKTNIGLAPNHTKVFVAARGRLFKWAHHDDICRPDFLQRCVRALDSDPGAVLAFPRAATIDEGGEVIKAWESRPGFADVTVESRFREALRPWETHPLWGLTRIEVLRRTPLLGSYPAADLPLLAELALYGHFYEVQEFLYLQREHSGRSVRVYDFRDPHQAVALFDPSKRGKLTFPSWRLLAEYVAAIRRAPLNAGERLRCGRELLPWIRRSAGDLVRDLVWALGRVPLLGSLTQTLHQHVVNALEQARLRRAARKIHSVTDAGDVVALVGQCWCGRETYVKRETRPYLERDGQYFGAPADNETAIRELERMRSDGVTHMAFAWPVLWWLDYYNRFRHHLQTHFRTLLEERHLIVFELRSPRH